MFNRCYDAGRYAQRLDYQRAPHAPLSGEDAAWAEALLREKGYREAGVTH